MSISRLDAIKIAFVKFAFTTPGDTYAWIRDPRDKLSKYSLRNISHTSLFHGLFLYANL